MDLLICTKTFIMDKTRNISKKWLVKKLVFCFRALKRCTKFKSNKKIHYYEKILGETDFINLVSCTG